jgi:hypothetical protein
MLTIERGIFLARDNARQARDGRVISQYNAAARFLSSNITAGAI